jgi:hypothetical protein
LELSEEEEEFPRRDLLLNGVKTPEELLSGAPFLTTWTAAMRWIFGKSSSGEKSRAEAHPEGRNYF